MITSGCTDDLACESHRAGWLKTGIDSLSRLAPILSYICALSVITDNVMPRLYISHAKPACCLDFRTRLWWCNMTKPIFVLLAYETKQKDAKSKPASDRTVWWRLFHFSVRFSKILNEIMDFQMIYNTKLEGCENSTHARNLQFGPLLSGWGFHYDLFSKINNWCRKSQDIVTVIAGSGGGKAVICCILTFGLFNIQSKFASSDQLVSKVQQ